MGASTGRGAAYIPTEPHYVSVDLHANASGYVCPTAIYWDDGRVFPIEKILRVEPMRGYERGRRRTGTRYEVQIAGRQRELFHDTDGTGRWYVRVPIHYIHDELCQIPPREYLPDWPAAWANA